MLFLSKVMHMIVALAFSFLGVAGIFFMLEAEFIAVAQIIIYAGAVTIIMLFGIMLTRHNDQDEGRRSGHKWLSFVGVAGFLFLTVTVINQIDWVAPPNQFIENNTAQIGIQLFQKYVIPFELTSIVLLVALIGAIIIAKSDDEDNVGAQTVQPESKEGEANE